MSSLPNGIHYAAEKFNAALYTLTGPGSQRERLANAHEDSIISVRPETLPEAMRYSFNEFREAITSVPSNLGEGAVIASIARMSDDRVSEMVRRFVSLYLELQFALRVAESRSLDSESGPDDEA